MHTSAHHGIQICCIQSIIPTCAAHLGRVIQTSKVEAPQAVDIEVKGSVDGSLSSLFGRARTSWLFSMSSFFMWLSRSCRHSKHHMSLCGQVKKGLKYGLICTWSSKQVCALPETRSDTWEELQVVISQRMVTIPRGTDAASRGGGEALPHIWEHPISFCFTHKESLTKIKLAAEKNTADEKTSCTGWPQYLQRN